VSLCIEVYDDGRNSADDEEKQKTGVNLTRGEDTGRPNKTPDDRRGEKDATSRARETLWLCYLADTINVIERKVEDCDLNEA
jgi:hypothetical protein